MQLNKVSSALLPSIFGVTLAIFLILSNSPSEVESRPRIMSEGWREYHELFGNDPKRMVNSQCENSSREVRELCQRCAKVTKSKLAYPMCCEGRENAREWCQELLMIG